MSKVQVDTIVDKDDISAPSLTKGAIVTGVCTATSFDGAISEWVLGADGTSHYTFTGSGLTGAENDPTLYLKRGQKYRFKNSSGGHPFRIQSTANGSAGTAYNDGVTNNDAGDGTTLEWDVQFDAPSVLYYQCTAHGNMGGKIYIGNSGNSSTLVDLNVSGVTTTGIGTVTTSVVVGSAVTANSDGVITSGIITATSFSGSGANLTGITALTGSTNNTVVTVTGSNAIAGEANLTYDGLDLVLNGTGDKAVRWATSGTNKWSVYHNNSAGALIAYDNAASAERVRLTSSGGVDFSNGELIESCKVTAGKLSDNQTINLDNGMVHLFTTTETTTATPNIMSTAGINTSLSNGDAITVTLITTAAAAAYCANIQVDGAAVTENWIGGSAPSAGGSSGVDIHTFTLIKTAGATFTVIGNQSTTS